MAKHCYSGEKQLPHILIPEEEVPVSRASAESPVALRCTPGFQELLLPWLQRSLAERALKPLALLENLPCALKRIRRTNKTVKRS